MGIFSWLVGAADPDPDPETMADRVDSPEHFPGGVEGWLALDASARYPAGWDGERLSEAEVRAYYRKSPDGD